MKRCKRLLSVLWVLVLAAVLWGCAAQQAPGEKGMEPPQGQPTNQNEEEPPEETLALVMERESFPLDAAQAGYTVQVPAGKQYSVVLAPQLERQTDQGWEYVECDASFCGTPDQLEESYEGFIELGWYPNLPAGTYRLSFQAWEGFDWDQEHAQYISATFDLTE